MKMRATSATLKSPSPTVELLIRESVDRIAAEDKNFTNRDSSGNSSRRGKSLDESVSTIADSDMNARIFAFLSEHGFTVVAGVDEAGRGPLAGPVVAAAVIIPAHLSVLGVDDSKKLSAAEREEVFDEIAEMRLPVSIGIIGHETIDKVNILRASLMAMRRASAGLTVRPDCLLIDGNHAIPNMSLPQMTVVGGDALCPAIGAASIIAKVTRDRIMREYARLYPQYSFSEHFGYPTPHHLSELKLHGPCAIHRKTFRPVADLLQTTLTLGAIK